MSRTLVRTHGHIKVTERETGVRGISSTLVWTHGHIQVTDRDRSTPHFKQSGQDTWSYTGNRERQENAAFLALWSGHMVIYR